MVAVLGLIRILICFPAFYIMNFILYTDRMKMAFDAHDCITRSQFIVNAAICITGHLSMQNIEKEMLRIGEV